MNVPIFIGFDPREQDAFYVAKRSIAKYGSGIVRSHSIVLEDVRQRDLFYRPMERRDGRLFDVISGAPCATEFATSRFLVPWLTKERWALFMDCDMLIRSDLFELFALADPDKAVMVVKHAPVPAAAEKMDGQAQIPYPRKCWSSVMLWNTSHPANDRLTIEDVNNRTGLWLHNLSWLNDDEIGELPLEWNWMPGVSPDIENPKIVHYTLGVPSLPGYEDAPYADEWREYFGK